MKGFFKRDLYLMLVGAKFYLIFILVLGLLLVVNKMAMSFVSLYVMVFMASTLLSLFNYDEQNGWGAYAAAVPDGRRAQVDARYLVALVVALVVAALQGVMCLLSGGEGQWAVVLLYAGMMLLYIALLFPLAYRFGNKSRLIMIALIAIVGGGIGAGGAIGIISGGPVKAPSFAAVGLALVALGAVAVVVSHRVSVAIVGRQEW